MSDQTPTPRTDAEPKHRELHTMLDGGIIFEYISSDFARTLERELAETTAKLDKIKRVAAICENINDKQTEMEAALTCSFNEAMLHDMFDASEDENNSLKGERDQLRADRDEAKAQLTLARNQGKEYAANELATALAERPSLRADKERLDWLENNYEQIECMAEKWLSVNIGEWSLTLRSAIDAARTAQMSKPLSIEEMKRDLEFTLNDEIRCKAIAENIRLFIAESGGENRSGFRVDLMKWEALANQAGRLREKIRARLILAEQ